VRHPDAFGHLLQALDFHLSPVREVALVSPAGDSGGFGELLAELREPYRPRLVRAGGPEGTRVPELMRDRHAVAGKPAAYVCEQFACKAPVTSATELSALLA
jgi:hypothetical protein